MVDVEERSCSRQVCPAYVQLHIDLHVRHCLQGWIVTTVSLWLLVRSYCYPQLEISPNNGALELREA
jgi:hypothetical protein